MSDPWNGASICISDKKQRGTCGLTVSQSVSQPVSQPALAAGSLLLHCASLSLSVGRRRRRRRRRRRSCHCRLSAVSFACRAYSGMRGAYESASTKRFPIISFNKKSQCLGNNVTWQSGAQSCFATPESLRRLRRAQFFNSSSARGRNTIRGGREVGRSAQSIVVSGG